MMHLKVVTPTDILADLDVAKIVAEAPNGSFGLLPRHVDFVSKLKPGVLIYALADGTEGYLGLNESTLVKCGDTVSVSTRDGIHGDNLATLREHVEEVFGHMDEQERVARTALARLEAGIIRRFIELQKSV